MQVAIDTSTATASLALVDNGTILAELTWRSEQNHTTQLLPNLMHLLKQTKLDIQSADCIIVALGPGSYNGLRVGLSTAKGLAFSLNVPIIGIGTTEMEAYPYAEIRLAICPIFNAGRGEIITALYRKKRNDWLQLQGERITTIEVLCAETVDKTLFCGEYAATVATELKQRLGPKAVVPGAANNLRRAAYLVELGLKRFARGDYDDVVTLQPLYLRGPAITKPKKRLIFDKAKGD